MLGVTLGSLYVDTQVYVPALLKNLRGMSCSGAYWLVISLQLIKKKKYWNGLPFPSPGDLPDSGIEPGSPALQAEALPSKPPGKPY